jgi:hypothetical protein
MSTVIVRRPVNRLAKLVSTPGGPTVAQALAECDARLTGMNAAAAEVLQGLLSAIQSQGQALGSAPSADQIEALYRLNEQVLSISAVAGHAQIGQAALCLCELLDGLRARGAWNDSAIKVHLDGLQLLSGPGGSLGAADKEAVVSGLRQVVQRTLR